MIFTKGVAVERGSAVVKNTYLQNVLVLDVVIKLLRSSKRAILDDPEGTLLVPRPDVPGSKGCQWGTLDWVSHTRTVGQQQHFLWKCGPNRWEGDCLLPVGQYLTQERLFHSVNTDYPILIRNFRLSCNFCEFKYSHCGLTPEPRSGGNVSSPLCGLLFPLRNSLFAEIAA